jgi:hypothetical protein
LDWHQFAESLNRKHLLPKRRGLEQGYAPECRLVEKRTKRPLYIILAVPLLRKQCRLSPGLGGSRQAQGSGNCGLRTRRRLSGNRSSYLSAHQIGILDVRLANNISSVRAAGTPTIIVVDRDGKVAASWMGALDESSVQDAKSAMLQNDSRVKMEFHQIAAHHTRGLKEARLRLRAQRVFAIVGVLPR